MGRAENNLRSSKLRAPVRHNANGRRLPFLSTSVHSMLTGMKNEPSMRELPDSCVGETLYPSEAMLARRGLGDRARDWPAKAVLLEREGMPKIAPLMGGRFWPAATRWFLVRHGLAPNADAAAPI